MVTTTTGLATSFITFSRTSNATVTDSNGFIEWAGHNLLTNSESFDASAWTKSNAPTVTANSTVAPDGTTTADTIAASSVNLSSSVFQNVTLPVCTAALQFYVRAGTATQLGAGVFSGSFASSTGQIVSGPGSISGSSNITITGLSTTVWTLVRMTVTIATAGTYSILFYPDSGEASGKSVALWGAHLYRSDLGGMVLNPARGDAYYPTTPRNLAGFSEDFGNALWFKTGASVTSDAAIAPNGLQTADKLVEDGSTGEHRLRQTVNTVGGTRYTLSFYAKAAERNWVALNVVYPAVADNITYFNLTGSGSIGTNDPDNTASITSVGDGWYRCSVTHTTQSAQTSVLFIIYAASANNTISYAGVSGSGIYLWGAQLSDSASLDAYSPVYGAAVTSAAYYAPRLDFDPVTLAARGLLVEEQRTNVLLHTAAFDNASWDKVAVGTASAPVVTANNATAPDGTLTADLVVFDRGAGTSGDRSVLSQAPSLSAGTYTQSVWLKAATAGDIGKQLALRNVAGGAYLVVTLTASWVRYERTEVWAVNNWEIANRQGITADTTVSAHVWGAQLEAGSFATSYIPTGAATATRTADVASVSTQAFPYSATEGTLVASGLAFNFAAGSSTNCLAALSDGTTSNANYVYSFGDTPYSATTNGGNVQANITSGSALSPNTVFKLGYAIKANDFAFTSNGASVGTDTSGSVPTANQLQLGRVGSAVILNGHIRQITYIPRRLTNSELQARTV